MKNSHDYQCGKEAKNVYIGKVFQIVDFLARKNLPAKALYPKFIEFLGYSDKLFQKQTEERIQRSADIFLFADEPSNEVKSEMLRAFISSFDERSQRFLMDFVLLVQVSFTASGNLMAEFVQASKDRNTEIRKTRFACLDDNGVQRRIKNSAPYAIYINCCYHHLAMCLYPWLQSVNSQLLGLWKMFNHISKNQFILQEIQETNDMKFLTIIRNIRELSSNILAVIKEVVFRQTSHGAACNCCNESYGIITEALNQRFQKYLIRVDWLKVRTAECENHTKDNVLRESKIIIEKYLISGFKRRLQRFWVCQAISFVHLPLLDDMSNDVNSIHFRSSSDFEKMVLEI